jgi:hypothetical protein
LRRSKGFVLGGFVPVSAAGGVGVCCTVGGFTVGGFAVGGFTTLATGFAEAGSLAETEGAGDGFVGSVGFVTVTTTVGAGSGGPATTGLSVAAWTLCHATPAPNSSTQMAAAATYRARDRRRPPATESTALVTGRAVV